MNNLVLITLVIAAVGAAMSWAVGSMWRRREAARELVRERPQAFITREQNRLSAILAQWDSMLTVARRHLDEANQALTKQGGAAWSGAALGLRVLVLAGVVCLFALSVLLNVEIFVALNGGDTSAAAVAKGVGASLLELVLAVAFTHELAHRKPASATWQVRFWSILALLAITLIFVYHYAPARSQQAIGPTVALDERRLEQAKTARLPNGEPDQPAISAAARQLQDDQERLHEAEQSDQAQSILFPLGEVLGGELALQGGLALVALTRLRRRRRDAVEAQHAMDRLEAAIDSERRRATFAVVDALVGAGHNDPYGLIAQATATGLTQRGALPSAKPIAPGRQESVHDEGQQPADRDGPVAEGDTPHGSSDHAEPINPDRLHRPRPWPPSPGPRSNPDDDSRWDLPA